MAIEDASAGDADGGALVVYAADVVGPPEGGHLEVVRVHDFEIRYVGPSAGAHIGVPRASIKCGVHARCFKYQQVNIDPDRASRHPFLIAWALAGTRVSREEHVDRFFLARCRRF